MTSFLCTDVARDIYERASSEFDAFESAFPNYRPLTQSAAPVERVLCNADALIHARRFLAYAVTDGRRGTPHKL